ncbi:MAG: MarR family winged helix-turn-helix transcriptional regulator [Nitrososphaerales archaeon]
MKYDPEFELWSEIRDIYRTALKRLNARLAVENMTFPQYNVLLALGRNGPMQMSTLGEHMLVAPANVTGLIDRIEAKGFVRRRRDPHDRRLWVIELTEDGAKVYRTISSRFRQYARGLGSSLSPGELAAAVASLDKVRRRVKEPAEL